MSVANYDVILCEGGIRTFETYTRNTLDISAIPIIHKLSHLPMASDPSHGTGLRDKVPPMARASVAAGADVLLIEVHPDPDKALSDGAQSLYPDQFVQLMDELRMIAPAVGRRLQKLSAIAYVGDSWPGTRWQGKNIRGLRWQTPSSFKMPLGL